MLKLIKLLVKCFGKPTKSKSMEKTKSPFFDPDTSFFELRIVRLTAISFILTFFMMCFLIVFMSNLWGKWDLTYSGFNNLLEYFKVPLGFLALIIPVGAVYAANHRSEQTKKQIYLTHQQNLFTNYYKHIEEFEKFSQERTKRLMSNKILETLPTLDTSIFDVRLFHEALFPKLMVNGTIQANRELLDYLDENFELSQMAHLTSSSSLYEIRTTLVDLTTTLRGICSENGLAIGSLMYFGLQQKIRGVAQYEEVQIELRGESDLQNILDSCHIFIIVDALERIRFTLQFIETCAKFDSSYTRMMCLLPIRHLLTCIPEEHKNKVLNLEYFSEDSIPHNEIYLSVDQRVSKTQISNNIFRGLEFSPPAVRRT
ncbi:hypothetical protein OPW32_17045 [Vibrio europaeus]|uniref:hypothetical protein n=1 Tax=Vibrio europaeus TaxID=300876 RepID=UPI00234232E8|nr:hypothetical protein [Vibrio europaeus]MDC5850903.1 hypothetical protein [Vibrio europaeus]